MLERVDGWVSEKRVPGVAAVVVDASGRILEERYAGLLAPGGEPVSASTLFALASLTKPIVAAACLVAVEEGLLDLDAEIRDGFGLRHLLTHMSGLPTDGDLFDAPPECPPGTFRLYSNAGYVLAGRLLAGASGMEARDYVRDAVIAPLDLDASLGLAPGDEARTATVREPGRSTTLDEPLFNGPRFRARGGPAGGGYASARGYAAFMACLLAGGSGARGAILARETVDEMLAPQLGSPPGAVPGIGEWEHLDWGLGFDVRGAREPHWTGDALSRHAATHFGAAGTLAWLDPERGVALACLANRGTYSGWWSRAGGWADLTRDVVAAVSG